MQNISLEELGLDKSELAERLVDRLTSHALKSIAYDEDGNEFSTSSKISRDLEKMIEDRLNEAVDRIAESIVLPRVTELVEGAVLQRTNNWGEKVGEPVTFKEFMVQRADKWLREEVNYEGHAKGEGRDSYNWRSRGTRVDFLIDRHLQFHIERAMKEAVANANKSIIGGLKEAVDAKLKEIAVDLKVDVKSK